MSTIEQKEAYQDGGRILSIQSHVVSGYVGNRAATFPLQTLGYDVDVINTVQFSNHTGYGFTDGHKTSPEQLAAIFNGMAINGLLTHSRILTGYIPSAQALGVVAERIRRMKTDNPSLIYLLDPVMGDIGTGLYVSRDVVPIYREMLNMATIITPNQFEVELLSGIAITSLETLQKALKKLHTVNQLPHIAFSSIPLPISIVESLSLPAPPPSYTRLLPQPLPPWYDAVGIAAPDDEGLVCFASSWSDGQMETYAFALPTIRGYFSGVGDLFSAMVLAHFKDPKAKTNLPPLPWAVSKALLTVQQILLQTHVHSLAQAEVVGAATPRPLHHTSDCLSADSVIPSDTELDALKPSNPKDPKRKARRMRLRELRVVQERALIQDGGEGWPGKRMDWTYISEQFEK
ncbi:pyridoxal kinase [Cryptococcus gattii E566]|uniref:pyridoxal kinase n=1 Tax=Cryptococcus gattii EJB2 TaxID=1296103 RepID=A0ABR5BZ41_9TREE|nr:pyridoxal kinase [Cryptococcus gattii EJB2]KIY33944.1 pyridoxal kinase [Cryptococcus gattii E566]KJD99663.1 pyridoxal kinase [Cryptococcus gattii NT-10]